VACFARLAASRSNPAKINVQIPSNNLANPSRHCRFRDVGFTADLGRVDSRLGEKSLKMVYADIFQ